MTKSLKPKLRFKGFSDAWEQRKFKETILIERGGSPRPIEDFITNNENGLNWVKIGDAPEIGKYITKTAEKIKPEGLIKTREVYPGDLILSNSMSFGKPYIMAIKGCIHDGWLLLRNDKKIFDLLFLSHLLGTDNMLQQYQSFAAGSTVHNLNKELVGNTNVLYPKKLEQSKIGTFFDTVDNLITLQQCKLDKISNLKKAMLAKMFPKNGSDTPEVRFKGFSDNWELHKLSKIASMHARIGWQNLRKSEFLNSGDYYLITGTDFIDGKIDFKNCYYVDKERYEQDKNIQIQNGSILITKDGTLGKVAFVKDLDKPATLNAGVFNIKLYSDDIDRIYLYQYLKAPFLMSYISQKATGGTIKHLNQNILVDFYIASPKKEEQKKIGTFFSNLDNLITLYQQELEKLKNIKKSCLEKMFV